jgi:hypothetical protein
VWSGCLHIKQIKKNKRTKSSINIILNGGFEKKRVKNKRVKKD